MDIPSKTQEAVVLTFVNGVDPDFRIDKEALHGKILVDANVVSIPTNDELNNSLRFSLVKTEDGRFVFLHAFIFQIQSQGGRALLKRVGDTITVDMSNDLNLPLFNLSENGLIEVIGYHEEFFKWRLSEIKKLNYDGYIHKFNYLLFEKHMIHWNFFRENILLKDEK
ncbi:MAG: hypothetical protein GY793_02445 [Proteobacteria bacterium]|nr:hypothetical protein [Pseudomonadota bacterium]